jgi:hypothetical protein
LPPKPRMHQRDFIIGSLHGLGTPALVELTPSTEQTLPAALEQLEAAAADVAVGVSVGGTVLYDVERTFRKLRDLVMAYGASPATMGVLVDRALGALPRSPAADVAIKLVGSLREDQLAQIGRAGILALRDATCLAPAEEGEAALNTLDAELERRAPEAWRQVGTNWIIADGTAEGTLEAAAERVERMQANSRLAGALEGLAVMVVPSDDCLTDRGVLLAHLKAAARRELDPRIGEALSALVARDVSFLDEERVAAEALRTRPLARHAQAAKQIWRGLAARFRVGSEPLAAQ